MVSFQKTTLAIGGFSSLLEQKFQRAGPPRRRGDNTTHGAALLGGVVNRLSIVEVRCILTMLRKLPLVRFGVLELACDCAHCGDEFATLTRKLS